VLGLLGLGSPLLIYNNPLGGLAGGQIYFNDHQGGVDAAAHLLDRGYRELGVISLPKDSLTGQRRAAGFIETLKRRGDCRLTEVITAAEYGEGAGYQCVDGLMAGGRPPRAIFCGGDLLAYGAIKRLEELGLSVPGDVAVIGYGDFKVSSFYHPQLTTIRMDLEQMGREIGRWVIRVVQDDEPRDAHPFIKKLPVELIVRETT
jgi:LacI family transcriptional regulator